MAMANLSRLSRDLTDLLQPAPAVSKVGYFAIGAGGMKTREEREKIAGFRSSYAQDGGPKPLEDYGSGDAAHDVEELFDYNVDRGRDKPISSSPRLVGMNPPAEGPEGPRPASAGSGGRRSRPSSAASSAAGKGGRPDSAPFRPMQTVNAASVNMSLLELAHSQPKYRAIEYHGVAVAAAPARGDDGARDLDSARADAEEEAARRGRWAPGKSTAARLAQRSAKWYRPRSAPAGPRHSHFFRTTYRGGEGFVESLDGTPAIAPQPKPPKEDVPPLGHYRPRFTAVDKSAHVPTFAQRPATPPRASTPPPPERSTTPPIEKPVRPSSAFRSPSRERPPSGRLFPRKASEAPDVVYETREELTTARTPSHDFGKLGDRTAPIPGHVPLQMSDAAFQPDAAARAPGARPQSAGGGVPFRLQLPREQVVVRAAQEQLNAHALAHNLVYPGADPLAISSVASKHPPVPDFSRQMSRDAPTGSRSAADGVSAPGTRPNSAAAASAEAHPTARLDCSETLVRPRKQDVVFDRTLTREEENRSNASRDFTQNSFSAGARPASTGPYAHNLTYDGAVECGKKRLRSAGEFHQMLGRPGSAYAPSSSGSGPLSRPHTAGSVRPQTAASTRPSSAGGFGATFRSRASGRPSSAAPAFRHPPASPTPSAGPLPEAPSATAALKRQEGACEHAHNLVYEAHASIDRLGARSPATDIARQLSREARARMQTPKPAASPDAPEPPRHPKAKDALIEPQRMRSPDFAQMQPRKPLVAGGLRAVAAAPPPNVRAANEREALMSIARQRLAAAAAATAEREKLVKHLQAKYGQDATIKKRR